MLTLKLAVLTPKRHFLVPKDVYRCISWNSPMSGVGCTLVQEPPPQKKKNAIEDVYVGCLPESDPLCKCYETWHGGSYRVCNRSDRCWSTPVNRFRCDATRKLSPCHRQGPSGLLQLFPLPRERVMTFVYNAAINLYEENEFSHVIIMRAYRMPNNNISVCQNRYKYFLLKIKE